MDYGEPAVCIVNKCGMRGRPEPLFVVVVVVVLF